MDRLKPYKILTALILCCYTLSSQIDTTLLSVNDTVHNYYVLKSSISLTSSSFLSDASAICNLGPGNDLTPSADRVDSLDNTHKKMIHTIDGVPVEYSKVILHSDKNGRLTSINGIIENNFGSVSTRPSISAETAINNAIKASDNQDFLWLDTDYENSLKEQTGDPDATSYPTTSLFIAKNDPLLYNVPENYFLAYKVPITYEDRSSVIVYVNALDGRVVKTEQGARSCSVNDHTKQSGVESGPLEKGNTNALYMPSCAANCQTGTASMYYYPNQYIYTEQFTYGILGCRYRLKEVCTGTYIYVTDGGGDFRDASNNWTTASDSKGTTTFWSLSWANRFWSTYLGRNSFDNNYHQISGQVGATYPTQFSTTTGIITIGKVGGNWAGSIDVMGHELTHGVTDTECQLIPTGESGAIGEGISDIFGTMTEFWTAQYQTLGRSANYDYAEDITSACGSRRSLSNPEYYCEPNTYGAGSNWHDPSDISSTNDFGGVHYNCGVLGKWFYLVCEGGSGTNDLGNQYCVKGIGRDNASWILYEALRNYMTSTTDFDDLRFYTEATAWQYYGFSPDYHAVAAAWYAVGLENLPTSAGLPVNINGKTETTNKNYNYNSRIQVYNYNVNPSTVVTMSSGDNIHFFSEDPPQTVGAVAKDIVISSGAEFHAYIAPGCTGGARTANTNKQPNNSDETLNKLKPETSDFNISPNPNNGEFKLNFSTDNELPNLIVVRDISGKEIKVIQNPTEHEYNLNLNNLNSGLYFINSFYENKTVSKKFVKN